MRPRPVFAPRTGGLGLRLALWRYRRFFGLRTFPAVSSVASGRIEFVSRAASARQFYGLSFRLQLLSTPRRRDAVTFNSWREAPPQRDFHPPMHAPSQAHWNRPLAGRFRRLAEISSATLGSPGGVRHAKALVHTGNGFWRDAKTNRRDAGSSALEKERALEGGSPSVAVLPATS